MLFILVGFGFIPASEVAPYFFGLPFLNFSCFIFWGKLALFLLAVACFLVCRKLIDFFFCLF